METQEYIEKVFLNEGGVICIKPQKRSFDMIYRSAMGVHWNEDGKYLSHTSPHDRTCLQWYEQIVNAVKGEYGIVLKTTPNTIYEGLDDSMIQAIESK